MSCKEFVELATDYLEGTLSEEDARRFEQHIEGCVWCERYIQQMRTTVATVGRIDEASISPEARDDLLHAFRGWSAERQAP